MRIWHYHNDTQVKVNVTEKPMNIYEGGPTEEGYQWGHTRYWTEGPWLYRSCESESRDCDGRYSSGCEQRARIIGPQVETIPHPYADEDYTAPDGRMIVWRELDSHQRDHSAEAMGY